MVANIDGTCCPTGHTANKGESMTDTPSKPKVNINPKDPVIACLFVAPLALCGVLFLVAELIGAEPLLYAIVAIVVAMWLVQQILSSRDVRVGSVHIESCKVRKSLNSIPTHQFLKIYAIVLAALIFGFVVPVHEISPDNQVIAVLLLALTLISFGYDMSSDKSDSNLVFLLKWGAVIGLGLLLLLELVF